MARPRASSDWRNDDGTTLALHGSSPMKVGFIGTGTMGQPMVTKLLKKGFAVVGYDVAPAALEAALRLGAAPAGPAAAAALRADLAVALLPSSAHVGRADLCPAAVLDRMARGRLSPAQPTSG